MIAVCFGDGLGNQMFQYAFYLELQYRYPDNLVCADIDNFYGAVNQHDGFELQRIFNIELKKCTKKRAAALADFTPLGNRRHPFLNRCFGFRLLISGPKGTYITVDDPTVFYPDVFELPKIKSFMLRGNWINENYFVDVSEQLRKDFSFSPIDMNDHNGRYLKLIEDTNSVSVHVRRGDYVSMGITSLDKSYYDRAIKRVQEITDQELTLFIFSDDIEYSKQLFCDYDNVVFIEGNYGKNSYYDMQLMSNCKYNIIANSTFSFWGAWLNDFDSKIIVAPQKALESCKNPYACHDWIIL